ncbi:MAG: NPCBM/NEW2 domain-containing protein, partial [Lentisphaeria bacterium]|nr:NPCBM/NEW2 domain-containing protein [Lentisphaeria bacterium]
MTHFYPALPLRVVLASAGLICGLAVSRANELEATACYQLRDSWPETMIATRQRLHEMAAPTTATSFTSPVVLGKDPALAIDVDISDYRQFWLIADDGGDNINCDHAAWCDPVLIDSAGSALPLTQCTPVQAKVGWQRVRINEDGDGKPLQIGDKTFKTGFFAHAESRIFFDLQALEKEHGRDFVKLQAWVGIALSGRRMGSCRFRVLPGLDRASLTSSLWALIEQDFADECKAFRKASGKPTHEWLLAEDNPAFEEHAINSLLDGLKPHDQSLRATFTKLKNSGADNSPAARLDLFQRCLKTSKTVAEGDEVFALAERSVAMLEKLRDVTTQREAIAALQQRYTAMRAQADSDALAIAELVDRCRALRRELIMMHPALDFADILITQSPPPGYSHMCDQYLGRHRRPGPGLVLLRNWKT